MTELNRYVINSIIIRGTLLCPDCPEATMDFGEGILWLARLCKLAIPGGSAITA